MENTVMFQRGHFVILFIFGLSAAMGAFAVWTHYQRGRQSLAFWGSETANLIRHAPQVEYFRLSRSSEPPVDAAESLEIDGKKFWIERRLDVSQTPGLVHARHAFITDDGYNWKETVASDVDVNWQNGLRFTDGERSAVVLLDYAGLMIQQRGASRRARMIEPLAKSEKEFFERLLAADESMKKPQRK